MKLIKKLLCKMNFHKEEIESIVIQPILYSKYHDIDKAYLPARGGYMLKCERCGDERIIG